MVGRDKVWVRVTKWLFGGFAVGLLSACGTTSLLLAATGVATDISPTLDIVKHLHAKVTEGDPVACNLLNSVEHAFNERCGAYQPGSLKAADIARPGLPVCVLTLATRDPAFWQLLPELLQRGAQPEACDASPLVALAQANACPDFSGASTDVRRAIRWLAVADARAVQHDVMRLLSCPSARQAGLDSVLEAWMADGSLPTRTLAFSPLGALHPSYLNSRLALSLEAHGHSAQDALGAYSGRLAPGFEEALRTSHYQALDWWFNRLPGLVDRVPARQSNQYAWVPLSRVLVPTFLAQPQEQQAMAEYLLARGANPWQTLPAEPGRTVVHQAQAMKSPLLPLLSSAVVVPPARRNALARN